MREAVIVSALRTPVGSYGGSLQNVGAVELGSLAISAVLKKAAVDPHSVDEVLLGSVLQSGLGQNVARQAAIKAGLPVETPCTTVNKVCGSGLKTIALAATAIVSGEADIIVAGGTENMSAAPYAVDKARWGARMGDFGMIDLMVKDGLWCAVGDYHMGMTAENLAEKYRISREEQDQFAFESQEKAGAAIAAGRFKEEIVPVAMKQRKGEIKYFSVDEHPRSTSLEALAGLRPAFKKDGTVTAGNASGINDSAAAVLLMSSKKAAELGIEPLVYIRSHATAGVDPSLMGTGPIPASRRAMAKADWQFEELDLIEANEAFAAQALTVARVLDFDPKKVNVNGGAIAIGHPIGASGARILVTLVHEMHKRQVRRGLATLCIGGGQGIACTVERP